jgi:RHS repeat-associated protein
MRKLDLSYGLCLPVGILVGLGLSAGSVSAETVLSIVQTKYDANDRVICQAVRMNLATAATDACQYGAEGSDGPDRITETRYDGDGNVVETKRGRYVNGATNEQLIYATYGYTKNGQKAFEADANGNVTELVYDEFDCIQRMNYPSTSVTRTKAPCAASSQVYTGPSGGAGAAGCINPQAYTARGAPPSGALINPTPLLGDVNTANDATGDYETFGYDKNGNKTSWRRRNGQTIGYVYDNLNRKVTEDLPDFAGNPGGAGRDIYVGYDLLNRVTYKRYGSDTGTGVSYVYDKAGRMTNTLDMNGRNLWFEYNAAGGRTKMIWPGTWFYNITRDTLNRETGANWDGTTTIYTIGYDSLGRRTSLARMGATTTWQYDDLGRMKVLKHDLAGTDRDVQWDFAYNAASQLRNFVTDKSVFDYVQKQSPLESRSFDGLNRDTSVTAVAGGYDANGNLANEGAGGRALSYDIYNRLLTATGNGANLKLDYDPEGRLARYSTDGGASYTTFAYDGTKLVLEYDAAGNMQERYYHGPGTDEVIVWTREGGLNESRAVIANYQGSTIGWTNASGTLQEVYKYGPYGEPLVASAATPDTTTASFSGMRFRYTGQTTIPEASLYYYKARIYDPKYGRFLQTDPIGSKDDLNLYAYTAGDPINGTDPSGLLGCGNVSEPDCDRLTIAQDEAMDDIEIVQGAVDGLLQEREEIKAGTRSELSSGAAAFEQDFMNAFADVSNGTLKGVSNKLSDAYSVLADPGKANGGRYDFRNATSNEMRGQWAQSSALFRNPLNGNTIAIGGQFDNTSSGDLAASATHEALHMVGVPGVPYGGMPEAYGTYALYLALERGTGSAKRNPDNYVCVLRPGICRH